jgi:hypothetical protein
VLTVHEFIGCVLILIGTILGGTAVEPEEEQEFDLEKIPLSSETKQEPDARHTKDLRSYGTATQDQRSLL